ncbi:MAG: alpha/beta hydrolase [Chloroflexi bacterium]|nr:alpha/beta hydrolase [Chloroflexota bacterium]
MPLLTAEDYIKFPTVEPGFRYAYDSDPQQFGELTLPRTAPPHPVIVLIHGGGYRDLYDLRPLGSVTQALASEGFAVWNIEYRRAGNGGEFPNMFLDVGAAAEYLRSIADHHSLSLDGVIAIGHSAGGHLALWLAGRGRIATTSAIYSANPLPVAGVVALAPIADIADALDRNMSEPALQLVLGSQLPRTEANLKDTSPAEMLPLGARQIHLVGSEDDLIRENLQRYINAAEDAGDDVELMLLEGAGHFELVAVETPEWQTVIAAVRRLRTTIAVSLQ